jgi:uncharacterized protein (DUF362 family)
MKHKRITRREFVGGSAKLAIGAAAGSALLDTLGCALETARPVVSIARIVNDNVGYAVEEAIELIGGISRVTRGKERIMLKPNLVAPSPFGTTNPEVIRSLAQVMKKAGKDVLIGEGSAAADGFNVIESETFRTRNSEILDGLQTFVFDNLGYTELASSLGVPLVNLHVGEIDEIEIPDAFAFDKRSLHRSLVDIDLLCSVPVMKTHGLAQVTLGMKNLIGVYPGTVYQSVRGAMHDHAAGVEPSGTAVAIVDMVRANKLDLTVVDASMAMEGQGPMNGEPVKMDLIIAGTNPLATDMVTANLMGFEPDEVPTFTFANKAGMGPVGLDEIEIRGEPIESAQRNFVRAEVSPWDEVRKRWAVNEI